MELSTAIRIGIMNAMNGVISAPMFDGFAVPEDQGYPYVLVTSQTSVQRDVKKYKAYDAQVTFDIVTGNANPIGFVFSEGISEEIDNIMIPPDYSDLNIELNGYKIGDTKRSSDNNLQQRDSVNYVYRKIVTYNLIIDKI